jgi:hypothetical protein
MMRPMRITQQWVRHAAGVVYDFDAKRLGRIDRIIFVSTTLLSTHSVGFFLISRGLCPRLYWHGTSVPRN